MAEPTPLAEALAAANVLIAALAAERDAWKASAEDGHIYGGKCPDSLEGWDSRDPECSSCQRLISTARAVALALEHPSAPTIPPVGADGVTPPSGPCDHTAGRTEHHPEAAA